MARIPKLVESPTIPGYTIESSIGQGGMGVVWKAHQHGTNRLVAIKMIRTQGRFQKDQLLRFQHEAELISQVQDRNVVQIFHTGNILAERHGQKKRLPYFVMEYVGGGTLADTMQKRRFSPREAAELMRTIAQAMGRVHRKGIIHRDLKPANVLVTEDDQLKVGDFGLALATDREELESSNSVGTIEYMSPEQVRGGSQLREIQATSDVFAMGVIFFELLTGHRPFRAESRRETLNKIWEAKPDFSGTTHSSIPGDVKAICLKCLKKNPDARYVDGEKLADDLGRYLSARPIHARNVGRIERVWLWCRRNPLATSLVGMAIFVFAVFIELHRKGQETAAAKALADERQGRFEWETYTGVLEAARWEILVGTLAGAKELLRGYVPAIVQPDLRGWEWNYLKRRLNSELLQIRFSPKRYLYEPMQPPLTFSEESQQLILGAEQSLDLYDMPDDGTKRMELPRSSNESSLSRFSPKEHFDLSSMTYSVDGQFVAVRSNAFGQVTVLRARRAGDPIDGPAFVEVRRIELGSAEVVYFQFDQQAQKLATIDFVGVARVHDIQTGRQLAKLENRDLGGKGSIAEAVAFGFSPTDGEEIFAVRFARLETINQQHFHKRGVCIWRMTTNHRARPVLAIESKLIFGDKYLQPDSLGFDYSPDGRWIASSFTNGVRILNTGFTEAEGDRLDVDSFEIVRPGLGKPSLIHFFPRDHNKVAIGYIDGSVEIWELRVEGSSSTSFKIADIKAHDHQVRAISLSPNGNHLATSDDVEVKIWDARKYQGKINDSYIPLDLEEQLTTEAVNLSRAVKAAFPNDPYEPLVCRSLSSDHQYLAELVHNRSTGNLEFDVRKIDTKKAETNIDHDIPNPHSDFKPRIEFLQGTNDVVVFGRVSGEGRISDGYDPANLMTGRTHPCAFFFDRITGKLLRKEEGLIFQTHDRTGQKAARVLSGGRLEVVDRTTGKTISSAQLPIGPFYDLAFNPDASRLAILRYKPSWYIMYPPFNSLSIWEPNRCRILLDLSDGGPVGDRLRFSDSGLQLVVYGYDGLGARFQKTWDGTPLSLR